MAHKNHQRLQEEALERSRRSREGKPKARRGRSRQRTPYEHMGWQPRQDARKKRTNRKGA